MPSRREQIQMSDAELREYLRTSKTIIIISIGPGGFPHPMPMWYAVDDDGTVRMTTFRKSQKVLNVQRDPRVSLLVESGGGDYGQLRGVVIYGKAQVVDDLDAVKKTLRRVSGADAITDPAAQKGAEAVIGKTAAKRVAILVQPEKIVSWDHRKLGGAY
jgi:PPOX class probable F420-dependent enzyme